MTTELTEANCFDPDAFSNSVSRAFEKAIEDIKNRKARQSFRNKGKMPEVVALQKKCLETLNEGLSAPLEFMTRRLQQSPKLDQLFRTRTGEVIYENMKEAAFELAEEVFFCRANCDRVKAGIQKVKENLDPLEIDLVKLAGGEIQGQKGNFKLLACGPLFLKFTLLKEFSVIRENDEIAAIANNLTLSDLSKDNITTTGELLFRCEKILETIVMDLKDFYQISEKMIDNTFMASSVHDFLFQDPAQQDAKGFLLNNLGQLTSSVSTSSARSQRSIYSTLDVSLVLIHAVLFTMNLYGLAITAYRYANSLSLDAGTSGALQACTPLGSTIFSIFINWYSKRRRYRLLYIICIAVLIVGNLIYYLAEKVKSSKGAGIAFLIIGRFLLGAGGARMMTRKYVSVFVALWAQSKYQIILIGLMCIGLCMGPGFSAILEYGAPSDEEVKQGTTSSIVTAWNVFSFALIFVWSALLVVFIFFFKGTDLDEPQAEAGAKDPTQRANTIANQFTVQRDMERLNLLNAWEAQWSEKGLQPGMKSSQGASAGNTVMESEGSPDTRLHLSISFPNWQIYVGFSVLFFIKLVQEGFFTELPQLSLAYYEHNTKWIGFFYLISIVYVLPVSLAAFWASKYFRDSTILLSGLSLLLVACLIKLNYNFDQPMQEFKFYFGSALYFVSSLVAEAGASSVIPKVASPRYSASFFNAGMFAGTADTLGRASGNALYTLYNSFSGRSAIPYYQYIVNSIIIGIMIIVVAATWRYLLRYSKVKIRQAAPIEPQHP